MDRGRETDRQRQMGVGEWRQTETDRGRDKIGRQTESDIHRYAEIERGERLIASDKHSTQRKTHLLQFCMQNAVSTSALC